MSSIKKAILLLLLEVTLFVPGAFNNQIDKGQKSLDEYWAQTDLSNTELLDLLDKKICEADKTSYLSCVNSIQQMAQKLNLILEEDGSLRRISRNEVKFHLTEKSEIEKWSQNYDLNKKLAPDTFIKLFKKIEKLVSDEVQLKSIYAAGFNGYLSIAKDPHSYILPLSFYEDVVAKSDSRQSNVGFIAKRVQGIAIVRKVFESSPAEKAGLKKGDQIIRLNSVDVSTMLMSQFNDLLKIKDGDRLGLLIERIVNGEKLIKYLEILKTDFITPSVTSKVVEFSSIASMHKNSKNKQLGLLTLNKFAKNTCQIAKKHLTELMMHSVSGVLLDLRDNPGGQVDEAACVLNLFVDKGQKLFETRYLDPLHKKDQYFAREKKVYSGPLVVLINSGSASASEIVAGSLKDLGRATLVGERSFGKGTFQDGRIWGEHQKIAVFETEGMYYFPSGWTPQLVGIDPDIKAQFTISDNHRESEIFFNPIKPKDIWVGPQSITWIKQMQCLSEGGLLEEATSNEVVDSQIYKAEQWLDCRDIVGGI